MVYPSSPASTSLPDVAAPPRTNRRQFNREAALSWLTPIPAAIAERVLHQETLEVLQSRENRLRCSIYWYARPVPLGMMQCPRCNRFTPVPYFSDGCCSDCRENAFNRLRELLAWYVDGHFYANWFQRGEAWYSSRPFHFRRLYALEDNRVRDRHEDHAENPAALAAALGVSTTASESALTAQSMDLADEALEEVNFSELDEDLEMEIVHYRATGELQDPLMMTTVERQFEHPDADSEPSLSNESTCNQPECSDARTNCSSESN